MTLIFNSLKTKSLFIFIVVLLPSFIAILITMRYAKGIIKANSEARVQRVSQNPEMGVSRWLSEQMVRVKEGEVGDFVYDTLPDKSFKSDLVNRSGIIIAHKNDDRFQKEKRTGVISARTSIPKLQWFAVAEQDADKVFPRLNGYQAGIIAFFLLLFCIIVILIWRYFSFSRAIVNPMAKLADALRSVADGNFDHRLEIPPFPKVGKVGFDEVGCLMKAFNEMAEELRSRYDILETKITDTREKLMQTDDELKKSREALARSETLVALGQLSAGIAHEIRTPLTSIKLFIQSLEEELPLDDEQNRGFDIIRGEIDRMEETVRRFLDFARTAEPKFEMVAINKIIADAVSLVKTRIKRRGIILETSEGALPPISADKKQLTQVFLNLFLNSIEAMPAGGKIVVSVGLNENEESLMITVEDTGCGIEESEIPYIFDPFFTTKETGTGMGLAIVYNAIEQHSGKIEVESRAGEGTRFTLSLPRSLAAQRHAATATERGEQIGQSFNS